jgi:hypothetical protein
MVDLAEIRHGKPGTVPVFLDPTGRRWMWFRLFAGTAIGICLFGFGSVIIGSAHDPALPALELPFTPRQYAVPQPQAIEVASPVTVDLDLTN